MIKMLTGLRSSHQWIPWLACGWCHCAAIFLMHSSSSAGTVAVTMALCVLPAARCCHALCPVSLCPAQHHLLLMHSAGCQQEALLLLPAPGVMLTSSQLLQTRLPLGEDYFPLHTCTNKARSIQPELSCCLVAGQDEE